MEPEFGVGGETRPDGRPEARGEMGSGPIGAGVGGEGGRGGVEGGGGDGAGAGGGDDGGLGLVEEPLDGLAVGLVAQFAGELEDAGGAEGGHADSAAAAVHFLVAVLVGGALGGQLGLGFGAGGNNIEVFDIWWS